MANIDEQSAEVADGPLTGIRVLDFSRHMAGPYAAVMLADYGADVIKVETLPGGDPSRRTGVDFIDGESALHLMWNRGKRSVALNLRTAEGLEIAHRLIASADVLIENYRPGVADEIGIGWKTVSELNPRIVFCSINGFGSEGPMSAFPATDPVVQAMSGVMSVTGQADGDPVLVGIPIADYSGALLGIQAVMAGLMSRDQTGRAQRVEVSLLGGLLFGLTTRLAHYWASGENPRRFGSSHSVVVPYQVFATSDGYAMAGTWGPDDWPRFCRAVGRPEMAEDPRYSTNELRMSNRDVLLAELDELFRVRSTAEMAERFRFEGALFGPVLEFDEILNHPQVAAMGLIDTVEHSTLGEVPRMGSPVRIAGTEVTSPLAAPVLGEHTVSIMEDLGYGRDEIDRLDAAGVVVAAPGRPAPR